jgi:hypothetical protein
MVMTGCGTLPRRLACALTCACCARAPRCAQHAAAGRKAGRGRQSVSANEPESDVHDSDRDELSDMKTRAAGDGPATAKTQPAGGSDDDDDDDDDLDVPFAARRSKPAESVKQRKKSAQKGGSKPISTENSTTNSQKGLQKKVRKLCIGGDICL